CPGCWGLDDHCGFAFTGAYTERLTASAAGYIKLAGPEQAGSFMQDCKQFAMGSMVAARRMGLWDGRNRCKKLGSYTTTWRLYEQGNSGASHDISLLQQFNLPPF
ncbi:unnamed protein product, partial [Urochloa humidicola]